MQAKKEYEEKLNKELDIKKEKEVNLLKISIYFKFLQEEISRLEQREMELIQKLQNTQNVQKQAFEDLQKALTANVGEEEINANGQNNAQSNGKSKK